MCKLIEETLDLRKGNNGILHVLDIGCGRGQDISKWKLARVNYMVSLDFSPECIKSYEERWR
jgi:cyclopropane fatty-acyl-phospholipid synthase-like methyltransferase